MNMLLVKSRGFGPIENLNQNIQMKKKKLSRRIFLEKMLATTAIVSSVGSVVNPQRSFSMEHKVSRKSFHKIGIIGLDTSHSEVFSKIINEGELKNRGFKVVAAYPHGSKDIASALDMKQGVIDAVRRLGVEIVDSIEQLLANVDFVLLESNDGKVHLEQAKLVFSEKKPVFIDKPLAGSLKDVKEIIALSKHHQTPFFSSSALRYDTNVVKVKNGAIGPVTGADVYTPAEIDPGHLDMAWYGIHGVEMLFTVMGPGCQSVRRVHTEGTDMLVGMWTDGRVGTVRGIRKGAASISGVAFGEKGISPLGPFTTYVPLVDKILTFFETRIPPFYIEETLEIFQFMHAADVSKAKNGKEIKLK